MLNGLNRFKKGIADAKNLSALYNFLTAHIGAPMSYDDILRFQIVYSVSAFDKLVHDLIRVGMVETYTGKRSATQKYHSESISIQVHTAIRQATIPPPEVVFEQEIAKKLKVISFQDPDKIADGLSYIWNEKHKWRQIANAMKIPEETVRKRLRLIAVRRNAIVHEADLDPVSGAKNTITDSECIDVTNFIDLCGESIARLVILP